MIIYLVLLPFVVALLISLVATATTRKFYTRFNLLDRSTNKDHPKHIHAYPVPRGGGIPIFLAMIITVAVFFRFDQALVGIFLGAAILLVLGIFDDALDLSPYWRLGLGFAVAAIVVMSGIGIDFVSNPLGEGVIRLDSLKLSFEFFGQTRTLSLWADLLAMLWIVWGTNFVNMGAKGLDGQLPGVVVIAAVVMGVLSFRFVNDVTTWPSAFLAFALAGAYAGFLPFNLYPQKIMPGWGGGGLAGYFLAVLAILSGAKVATALIVLGIPLMDVIYAVVRRVKAGRSPVWGDNQHLHHRLLSLGYSKRQVAAGYWLVTAILGAVALSLNSQAKVYTIFLIGVATGGLLLWLNYLIWHEQRA